jgi:hypothetical protein
MSSYINRTKGDNNEPQQQSQTTNGFTEKRITDEQLP